MYEYVCMYVCMRVYIQRHRHSPGVASCVPRDALPPGGNSGNPTNRLGLRDYPGRDQYPLGRDRRPAPQEPSAKMLSMIPQRRPTSVWGNTSRTSIAHF